MSMHDQIVGTTEVRRHNGQCAYGSWFDLSDEDVPAAVREAVADEIAEAMCRDMPHAGRVNVGGMIWLYR